MEPRTFTRLLFVALILTSYTSFFAWNRVKDGKEWEVTSFEKLVRGEAITPMQYRVLVPLIARGLEGHIDSVPLLGGLEGIRSLKLETSLDRVKLLLEAAWMGLLVTSFWACTWILLGELDGLRLAPPLRAGFASSASLLFVLALPFHFLWSRSSWYYPSDVPSVFFFTVGVTSLLTRRWRVFYPVFVLATLNRETSCFLTIVMLLALWREAPRRVLLGHAVVQAGVWIAIKLGLWWVYGGNTDPEYADVGGVFKNTVPDNLSALTTPTTYAVLASLYGYLWVPMVLFFRHVPSRTLAAALYVVPVFHLAMFVPGELVESRIYVEMLPVVVWGATAGALGALSAAAPALSPLPGEPPGGQGGAHSM